MSDIRLRALLDHARTLEERDRAVAATLALLDALADDVGRVRARGSELAAGLAAIPDELAQAEAAVAAAHSALGDARQELDRADLRVAELERARRRHEDELDQARRELVRAQEGMHDAEARVRRAEERTAGVRRRADTLTAEADALAIEADQLAERLRSAPRVSDAGKTAPGPTLADLAEWGGRARAALFVARGTLGAERERIVAEANALGAGALGEEMGATSVALVCRRLESALDAG